MIDDKHGIADAITSIVKRADDELFAKTEDELKSEFWFAWDYSKSVAWNTYQFTQALEMCKRRCRQWEERHNGSSCVVERVRDKYLMPRIKEFNETLFEVMGTGAR